MSCRQINVTSPTHLSPCLIHLSPAAQQQKPPPPLLPPTAPQTHTLLLPMESQLDLEEIHQNLLLLLVSAERRSWQQQACDDLMWWESSFILLRLIGGSWCSSARWQEAGTQANLGGADLAWFLILYWNNTDILPINSLIKVYNRRRIKVIWFSYLYNRFHAIIIWPNRSKEAWCGQFSPPRNVFHY